ncbi:MAG: phosphopyruvate hydratase [Chloroflexi bacterium]|nr:phosphopyruvate hydratase [Chloroflexota bacterium]|tara:strand:- start:2202 stop:3494 length:1293 start_codon:yes stop_codon:yes gene_type:complete
MTYIKEIRAREILDSRGNPTVEADVILSDGSVGRSAAPSGASTGIYEAHELRDGDPARYGGKGVLSAIENINSLIFPAVEGIDASNQEELDKTIVEIDGTENKSTVGANASLAVSLATAKAAALSRKTPLYKHINNTGKYILPVPMLNIINGGRHAENSTDIQEFMVVPAGFKSFSEAMRAGCEVYYSLLDILKRNRMQTTVGDEGGFAPSLPSNQAAIDLIMDAIEAANYKPGTQFFIALDTAAAELFDEKTSNYSLQRENRTVTGKELSEIYRGWVDQYPIVSIEDGLSEDEWDDWEEMTASIGSSVQLVGDDLLTTNPKRISKGVERKCGNAVLIKPNQIGTLSETLTAIEIARSAGWGMVMSHRSGETEDSVIADLSVGTGVGQIKTGAPARGERTAKYNQLIRIEEELGSEAIYAGIEIYNKYLG